MKSIKEWDKYAKKKNKALFMKSGKLKGISNEDDYEDALK